jgi:hypothetical protein
VATGERAQALQAGQSYADYMRREFDAAPPAAIASLMAKLRESSAEWLPVVPPQTRRDVAPPGAPVPGPEPGIRGRIFNRGAITAVVTVIVLSSLLGGTDVLGPSRKAPVIVVDSIRDYSGSDSSAPAMGEMLATHLARVPGLKVLSTGRVYELMGDGANRVDLNEAARQAQATDLLQGALFRRPNGNLRLELRRIDVIHRVVQQAYAVEGADRLSVTDSITAHIAAELGTRRSRAPR